MTNEEKAKRLDEIASCPLCMQAADAPLLRESAAMWRDISEARKDGARLDWLISASHDGTSDYLSDAIWDDASNFYFEDKSTVECVRAAIDAAMGGE